MKFITFVFLFFGVLPNIHAQQLHLEYILQVKDGELNYNLYFDGAQSIFILEDTEIKRFDESRRNRPTSSEDSENNNMIYANISDGKSLFDYKNYKTRSMLSRELAFDGKKHLVQDIVPEINWTLTGEKKIIGSLSCQKATATWRCSEYEVWFTSDILVDIGPWKLSGLPGLIVEAHNKTVNHTYKLIRVSSELNQKAKTLLELQLDNEPIYTFQVFAEKQKKEIEKIKMFLKNQAGNPSDGTFKAEIPECY